MRIIFVILSEILLLNACNYKQNSKSMLVTDKTNEYIPKDTGSLYFPLETLHFTSDKKNRIGDSLIKAMCSEILFQLKEPVLYKYSGKQQIVRLLWLRPFDNPVVIRINNWQGKIFVNIKEVKQEYHSEVDYTYKTGIDTVIMIGINKWNKIISSLYSKDFWKSSSSGTVEYEDATIFILEGYINNKYHCITRTIENTAALDSNEYVKDLYEIGNNILSMKNRKE